MTEQSKKYRLHPEVEEEIRLEARKFVSASMLFEMNGKSDPYVKAAESGIISFDDVYFLGVANAAEAFSLEHLIETGLAKMVEVSTEFGDFRVPAEDDSVFRRAIEQKGNYFVGLIYNILPEEAEKRFYDIHKKVIEAHNKSLERGK